MYIIFIRFLLSIFLRRKFIQFQSHEYLHLSLTLSIHLVRKIDKINNNGSGDISSP